MSVTETRQERLGTSGLQQVFRLLFIRRCGLDRSTKESIVKHRHERRGRWEFCRAKSLLLADRYLATILATCIESPVSVPVSVTFWPAYF